MSRQARCRDTAINKSKNQMNTIQGDKELLFTDLSARLQYDVKVCIKVPNHQKKTFEEQVGDLKELTRSGGYLVNSKGIDYRSFNLDIKPYLRKLSSMTEEEYHELEVIAHGCDCVLYAAYYFPAKYNATFKTYNLEVLDWLNKHYFDFRGLIEKGLALEAPEGMYSISNK